ncbi:hypothetical protein ACHQM5_002916 [Ranunculus cassubicifolius]
MTGDGEAITTNSKRLRLCDRISSLPDSLIFCILSLLKMEDVMKTTLLSKRWRYFWTAAPCLNFKASVDMINRQQYEAFVDRALFAYEASKLKKFRLSYFFRPDSNSFQVDSWIRFVVRRDVEEMELDFIYEMRFVPTELENYKALYKLHSSCFNSASLTRLTLRFCILNLPASMCLSSLKVLCLELLELNHDEIKKLTTCCPVLEELFLNDCNRRSDLNICIPELPLKSLKIEEFSTDSYLGTAVEIYAPNLQLLEFHTRMQRSKYHFKGPSSLLNVRFDFVGGGIPYDEYSGHPLVDFLEDLHCAQNLNLDAWCLQALTMREMQGLPVLSLKATSLEMFTTFETWEIPGISYMLRSCPFLETLVIAGDGSVVMKLDEDFKKRLGYRGDGRKYWQSQELIFSFVLQNVKTITLKLFAKENEDGEDEPIEKLFKIHQAKIELVRVLLNSCKVLKELIITRPPYNPWADWPLDLPPTFAQYLLDMPRASPVAQMTFI